MAFELWTPPRPPHIGTSLDIDQVVLEAKFGDGYTQILGDGLNNMVDSVTLSWSGLDAADFATIATFYRLKGKATPFLYLLPWEIVEKLWRFSGPLNVTTPAQSRYSISVPVKQAFDIA